MGQRVVATGGASAARGTRGEQRICALSPGWGSGILGTPPPLSGRIHSRTTFHGFRFARWASLHPWLQPCAPSGLCPLGGESREQTGSAQFLCVGFPLVVSPLPPDDRETSPPHTGSRTGVKRDAYHEWFEFHEVSARCFPEPRFGFRRLPLYTPNGVIFNSRGWSTATPPVVSARPLDPGRGPLAVQFSRAPRWGALCLAASPGVSSAAQNFTPGYSRTARRAERRKTLGPANAQKLCGIRMNPRDGSAPYLDSHQSRHAD